MPLLNCCSVCGPTWFIIHPASWLPDGVTVHNSSTSSPGWAMTMPGPSCAVTVKQHEH